MKAMKYLSGTVLTPMVVAMLCGHPAMAQNIVSASPPGPALAPTNLGAGDVSKLVFGLRSGASIPQGTAAARARVALEAHTVQLLDGWPWRPFQHTLGISGYEVSFDHPDEMFHALALALPHLSAPLASRTKQFLAERLNDAPPFARSGFDRAKGRTRESYDVPENLRVTGSRQARSAFGIYAFWEYLHFAGDTNAAGRHWPVVQGLAKPLLTTDYAFDPRKPPSGHGDSQKLNGDLAGVIAVARLARLAGDAPVERRALARARELLELRVNLERVNPAIIEKSSDATKGLHNFKLARYCDLTPEVGAALRRFSGGFAEQRLRAFREERNGWFMAFGDRFIGGENYTNPLHFPRSLFAGAALVEGLPAEELSAFLDVPWCPADFYFIEKCALALSADATPTASDPAPASSVAGSAPRRSIESKTINVIVINFDPVLKTRNNLKLHQYMKWSDPWKLTDRMVEDARVTSHGYVDYRVVEKIEHDGFTTFRNGFTYTEETFLHMWEKDRKIANKSMTSFQWLFEKFDLAARIRAMEVSEVWLWGAPYMQWDELHWKIPGDRIPYQTENPWFYRPYDIPDVGRTIWIMGWNYERGEGEMLESYSHRIESVLSLTVGRGVWDPKRIRDNAWNQFSRVDKDWPGESEVGTVHYAPNSMSDYDWGNTNLVWTFADDWLTYPDLPRKKKLLNAKTGGWDGIVNHHLWWMTRLPHAAGVTEGFYNNWWQYIVNYDEAVRSLPPPRATFQKAKTAMYAE